MKNDTRTQKSDLMAIYLIKYYDKACLPDRACRLENSDYKYWLELTDEQLDDEQKP